MKTQSKSNPNVHASNSGKLFVKDIEFFKSVKVQETLKKLLASSIYKHLKSGATPQL